jgi:HSP20 family protein
MPSLQYLNTPPNPFWTFVHDLEDHPFFAGRAGPPGNNPGENVASEAAEASGSGERATAQQPTAEDPPEVDPATLNANANATGTQPQDNPWAGRGRFFNPLDGQDAPRRGYGCRGRGRGGFGGGPQGDHPMGPPPFSFGGPWWARHVPGMDDPEHPHPHEDPHHHPGPHHGGGPHHHRGGPAHHRGGGGRRHSPGGRQHSPPRGFPFGRGHGSPNHHPGFNLGEFLNNLGNRLGVDLSGAAENMGLDRFTGGHGTGSNDADFEPRGDIFDTAAEYIVHLSLPGAKKSDVGVDWDGENSVLRVAGVVHRPGADEELLSRLVVDQRKREVGVFEKNIRLGTRRDPASIDIKGISAKMMDGVLIVRVPKVEVEHKKREVPIGGSPAREVNEKNVEQMPEQLPEKASLLDAADEEMYDAASTPAPAPTIEAAPPAFSEKEQIAQHAYQQPEQDVRSETRDIEHHDHEHEEKAPAYEESDWEKDGSEDEGEYVKINVD